MLQRRKREGIRNEQLISPTTYLIQLVLQDAGAACLLPCPRFAFIIGRYIPSCEFESFIHRPSPARPSRPADAALAAAARRCGDDRQGVGDEDGRAEVLLRGGHGGAHGPRTREDRDAGAGPACAGER